MKTEKVQKFVVPLPSAQTAVDPGYFLERTKEDFNKDNKEAREKQKVEILPVPGPSVAGTLKRVQIILFPTGQESTATEFLVGNANTGKSTYASFSSWFGKEIKKETKQTRIIPHFPDRFFRGEKISIGIERMRKDKEVTKKNKKHKSKRKNKSWKCYTSITGERVIKGKTEILLEMEENKLDNLKCPILCDFPKTPILFDGHLFDEDSLRTWFLTSNVHPLTGEKITTLKFTRVPILRYLFLSISKRRKWKNGEKKEILIFHSRQCSYLIAEILGCLWLPGNCRTQFEWTKPLPKRVISLSPHLLSPFLLDIGMEKGYITLENILACPISNKQPNYYDSNFGYLLYSPNSHLEEVGKRNWKILHLFSEERKSQNKNKTTDFPEKLMNEKYEEQSCHYKNGKRKT